MGVASFGFFGLIGSLHSPFIITGKHGFVTVGASCDILFNVEKLWIMTTWTPYLFGRQCLEN